MEQTVEDKIKAEGHRMYSDAAALAMSVRRFVEMQDNGKAFLETKESILARLKMIIQQLEGRKD